MKKGKKRVLLFILLGLVAVGAAIFALRSGGSEMVITGTAVVPRKELSSSVTASGTLAAVEQRDVFVEASVKVLDILVDEGEAVTNGQQILNVDLTDLNAQLEQTVLNRDSQILTLRRIRDLSAVVSLETLQLAVRQAEAVLASDKVILERARNELETNKNLHGTGAISDSELLRFERSLQDAQHRVNLSGISVSTARANLANSQTTNRRTDQQRALDIETQENMLELQELNVRNLTDRLSRVKAAIISPIDGVLTGINAIEGSFLSAVQPAYRVSDLGALEVEAQVKEVEARYVKLGQRVIITGDGIDEALQVEGIITSIDPVATIARTDTGEETVIGITITVENPTEELKPGLTVTARIVTDTREDVPVVRYAMLTETAEGLPAVFILQNGRAVLKPITMGITDDLEIEVVDGLEGGETAILNPPQELGDGMTVIIREAEGGVLRGGMMR